MTEKGTVNSANLSNLIELQAQKKLNSACISYNKMSQV